MDLSPGAKRIPTVLLALIAVLGLCATATAKPVPPDSLCSEQSAAVQQVAAEIRTHNAKPHTFWVPEQAAQANAYDAEAASLNARRASALARLRACTGAMNTLADESQGSLGLKAPSARTLDKIGKAKDRIPSNWKAPAPPRAGQNWEVPKSSPIRPLFEALRKGNPGKVGNARLRGVARPKPTDRDPAYPTASGRRIGSWDSGASKVSPDHIIPLAELVYMRGFMKLTPQNMYLVSRSPLNFQWLSEAANLSKQSRSAAYVSGAAAQWVKSQRALENETRKKLLEIIEQLLKSQ